MAKNPKPSAYFTDTDTFETETRTPAVAAELKPVPAMPVKEKRDRKVQCLFRPSVWDGRLDAMAQATGETKNELLNRALEAYLEQNGY